MTLVTIKKNTEIQKILKNGKKYSSPFFNCYYLIKEGEPTFAIAAPKKIFPKAVARNKAKRRLRAAIAKVLIKNVEAVILAKAAIIDVEFSSLILELERLSNKLNS